jgi:riboflavin kinase/FMN adenylyltransferase
LQIFIDRQKYYGLLHFGFKDVFKADVSAEILIRDFEADIYNQTIKVQILEKVREVRAFNNIDELKLAIENDLLFLKKYV